MIVVLLGSKILEDIMKQFVLFVLAFLAKTIHGDGKIDGAIFNCDRICKHSAPYTDVIAPGEDDVCEVYTEYEPSVGVPPPPPKDITFSWYSFMEETGETKLALNISWKGYCSGRLVGYLIELSPGESMVSFDTYLMMQQFCTLHYETMVDISYSCYGMATSAMPNVKPGEDFYVQVLPLPVIDFNSNEGSIFPWTADPTFLHIPGCDSNEVINRTITCQRREVLETTLPNVYLPTTEFHIRKFSNILSEYVVYAIIGLLLLLVTLCLVCCIAKYGCTLAFRKDDLQLLSTKFLVVINKSAKTDVQIFGDKLACSLKRLGMPGTYTLWKTTEIDNTGATTWLGNQIKNTDYLILLYGNSMRCPPSSVGSESCSRNSCSSETTKPLINQTLDHADIAWNLVDQPTVAMQNFKYSVVRFHSDIESWISNVPRSKVYQLPEDITKFGQNALGINNKENLRFLEKSFKI
ncbi:uncharacterized protein LOC143448456 isoform X1 [Clavelina lepadiformis]|uniref:uncharacterized protein LOC143448456 isoform X1 n=1 Tax=Clavelina lepadiformis TaxID=159417 RepID=UPI0040437BA1